jgi:hypothetical protein
MSMFHHHKPCGDIITVTKKTDKAGDWWYVFFLLSVRRRVRADVLQQDWHDCHQSRHISIELRLSWLAAWDLALSPSTPASAGVSAFICKFTENVTQQCRPSKCLPVDNLSANKISKLYLFGQYDQRLSDIWRQRIGYPNAAIDLNGISTGCEICKPGS